MAIDDDATTFFPLMMLSEVLIINILLCSIDGEEYFRFRQYVYLGRVCLDFCRFVNSREVLLRLSPHYIRINWPRVRVEQQFLGANHPEAVCYQGMEILTTHQKQDHAIRLALINQAADAGDTVMAYFLAMLQYRSNPMDPRALTERCGIVDYHTFKIYAVC
ncbi:hypothetical protein ACP70R_046368 [Stipagrostis hirtigluma subsp. patula]